MEGILKGLLEWLYGLFLDLLTYCANALLGVMNTDLAFFETSVPVVVTLYKVFVAVGWGLLIGNLAFQALKIMLSGMGFETEPPAVLFLRTVLFGVLLVFSKDICEIGLSLGKNVIDLIGVPTEVELSLPTADLFTGTTASWLLVIIIGFILGFQLIKLFFEIAERYVIVGVLTLLCPVGLSMGGSKSTKDIAGGYIRTFASAIVMMVMNVIFLKLILSALATMPTGTFVLPWCLLVVGIAKVARKADDLVAKIGMNPARTGDPLGNGGGRFLTYMAARTIINSAMKKGFSAKSGPGNIKGNAGGRNAKSTTSTAYNSNANNNRQFGGNSSQNNTGSFNQSNKSNATQSGFSSSHFGFTGNTSSNSSGGNYSAQTFAGGNSRTNVNTNRFSQNANGPFGSHTGYYANSNNKAGVNGSQRNGTGKTNYAKNNKFQKNRFGGINSPNIKHNRNPLNTGNKQKGNPPARFGNKGARKPVIVDIERTEEELGGKIDEQ